MKTRNITQSLLYFLVLNTFGSAESGEIVAVATSEQALKDWYEDQKMDKGEIIGNWSYTFKEGSLIRNYNPLYEWKPSRENVFQHGWFSEWVQIGNLMGGVYRVDF